MVYAEGTSVAVEKSLGEIVTLIKKAGAERVMQIEEPEGLTVQFFLHERMIKFQVRLPKWQDMPTHDGRRSMLPDAKRRDIAAQRSKQRARALLLAIKAKLESVASEVETFEEAFLSNVVMANGQTVYERISEPLALECSSGSVQQMFLPKPNQSGVDQ